MTKTRIQIVEDEGIIAEDTQRTLKMMGYEVTSISSTGADAIKNAEQDRPDLILMDIVIHGDMDGVDTAGEIRSRLNIPVIFLTAYTDEATLERAKITGPYGYLVKPYTERELQPAIETAIWKKKMEGQVNHLNSVLKAIRNVNQLIAKEKNHTELIQNICETLIETRGYSHAWIVLTDESGKYEITAEAGIGSEFESLVELMKDGHLPECGKMSLSQKEVLTIHELQPWCNNCPITNKFADNGLMLIRLEFQGKIYGLLTVAIPKELISDIEEQTLFEEIGRDIAFGLHSIEADENLKNYHTHLEGLVKERTTELEMVNTELSKAHEELEQKVDERTRELNDSVEELKKTKDHLVQSEKMAALGRLVSGVAHEINTPVGIGVTAASHMDNKTAEINRLYEAGNMKRSDLDTYLKRATESSKIILSNLSRAAELVHSFKGIAIDQSNDERRDFNLNQYIDDIFLSLHPKLKKTNHKINVVCHDTINVNSYPGAFSQILTNLIMNSLLHGFENIDSGEIQIDLQQTNESVILYYCDNGIGITQDNINKIFDPFFTTKRGNGGSGLGLYIVYNLVTQKLKGTIDCNSVAGESTTYTIKIPTTSR